MTIVLISLIWLGCLAALVWRLATRPERAVVTWKRSPRLLKDARADFEDAIGEILASTALRASKAATAQDVRDGSQEDLYVRP
jgi:hypothetical protein